MFTLDDGALYQALHRMQERGWLDSDWSHAENGKRARFYKLTAKGRRQLHLETASWLRYVEAVSRDSAAGDDLSRGVATQGESA